jgi:hypothetical protein
MVNFCAVCGCCTRTDIVRKHLEDTLRICDVMQWVCSISFYANVIISILVELSQGAGSVWLADTNEPKEYSFWRTTYKHWSFLFMEAKSQNMFILAFLNCPQETKKYTKLSPI